MTIITDKDGQKLLMQVADHLEIFPESHEQESWASECGTKACIAGWMCMLGTDDFEVVGKRFVPKQEVVDKYLADLDRYDREHLIKDTAHMPDWQQRSQRLAGSGYYRERATELLGKADDKDFDSYFTMFSANCRPVGELSTAEAMREIARGADISTVWSNNWIVED